MVKVRGGTPAWLLLAIAVLALVGAVYGRALSFPLLRDDEAHQLAAPAEAGRWNRSPAQLHLHFREEFWARGSQSGLYRPLTATTIQATEWIAGLGPVALKLGNALLLAATALAAAALAARLGVSRGAASLLALLIASHPLLSEPVLEVVSRSETQAALGVLLAGFCLTGHARMRAVAAGGWFLFALLSKEGAFAAAPALLVLALASDPSAPTRPRRLAAVVALVAALAIAVALRTAVFGDPVGLAASDVSRLDNALVAEPFATRLLTAISALGRYVVTFLWPRALAVDWSFAAIVPIEDARTALADPFFAAGMVAIAATALSILLAARRRSVASAPLAARPNLAVLFGLLLAAASWWLVSSIARPIGALYAERLFCASAIGLLLALVAFLDARLRSPATRRLTGGIALAIVVALAARSFVRAGDWRDGLALYQSASRAAPNSARTECTLAHLLRERGDLDQASAHAERALAILPEYGKAHTQLAICRAGSQDPGGALLHFWLATQAPGATPDDQQNFERMAQRCRGDPAALAEFRRQGEALVARRPDVQLHVELGRELARRKAN